MKQEVEIDAKNSDSMLNQELSEYKVKLETEAQRAIREHAREQDELVSKEEDRLEKERQIELREYEQALTE